MAKYTGGILSGISGKVGNIVGANKQGIDTIKIYQPNVNDKKTPAQLLHRDKILNINNFLNPLKSEFIKPVRDIFYKKQSGYNSFISDNLSLFANQYPEPPDNLNFTPGNMPFTPISNVTYNAFAQTFEVFWIVDSDEGDKKDSDKSFVYWFNPVRNEFNFITNSDQRSTGNTSVNAYQVAGFGTSHYFYLGFVSLNGLFVNKFFYSVKIF